MNTIANLTPQQLRQAADIQERIQKLQRELGQLLGVSPQPLKGPAPVAQPKKRKLSAQGIANIRAGVRKRMAKKLGLASPAAPPAPRKKLSAAATAKLSALAKARWRQAKAQGKTKL